MLLTSLPDFFFRLPQRHQGLVYEKAIKLRDLSGYTVGELVNICSNDGQRLFGQCKFAIPVSDQCFLDASAFPRLRCPFFPNATDFG